MNIKKISQIILVFLMILPVAFSWGFIIPPDPGGPGTWDPLEAISGGPYTCNEASGAITLTGSVEGGLPPYEYRWDENDDGWDTSWSSDPSYTYNCGSNTAVNFILEVRDSNANTDSDSTTLTVSDLAPTASFTSDAPQNEGLPVSFTDTSTYVLDPIVTLSWDFGDTTTSTDQNPTHIFNDGTYTVTLTATDSDGSTDTYSENIVINNVVPTAYANGPYTCMLGESIALDGSADYAGSTLISYTWDLDNDSIYETAGEDPIYSCSLVGLQPISLNVSDDDGDSSVDTTTVDVVPALAANANGPYAGNEGSAIVFTGSATGGYAPYSYRWDFNNDGIYDTAWSSVAGASYTWNDDYNGNVVLQVNDSVGHLITGTATVTVNNVNPTANAGGPYGCMDGDSIILNGSATDPGNDTFTYIWDLNNDGVYETTGEDPTYICSISVNEVNLTATDDDSGFDIATATINVVPALAANANGPYAGNEGSVIALTGSATGGYAPYSYRWDFNNDGIYDTAWSSVAGASYTWNDDYNGNVVLQVNDSVGHLITGTAAVTVNNVNPTANANGNYSCYVGETVNLIGSATDLGNDTFTYNWDLDNDSIYETPGQNVGYLCTSTGIYQVNLNVADDDGGSDTDSATINATTTPLVALPGGPYIGYENSPVTFVGNAYGGVYPYQFRWDFDGNGTWDTSWDSSGIASYTWSSEYTGTVVMQVSDFLGNITSATTSVSIYRNLVVDANGPYTGIEGSAILFNGSASGGLQPYQYRWDFDNDGNYDTTWSSTVEASHPWDDDYNGVVVLQVNDSLGNTATNTSNVAINNSNPTANADGPYGCIIGENITLYGLATDPGNDIITYSWDLNNDGTYETNGQNAIFTCAANGTYPVSLRAEDEDGGIGIDTTYVTTSIPTLLIDADGPYSGAEGFAISFSGSATGGLQPYQFRWDFDNDGAWDTAWASTPDASYSYSDDYNGTAVLMINDSAGTTAIDTSSVSVSNIAPIAEANGPYTCNEWEIITLAGYATDQGSDTFTYIWDLGDDGNYETPGQNPVYTCGLTGVYTVNLKVTDDDGGYSSDTAMINVGSVSPPIPPPPENDTTPPTIIINSPKPITYFGADVLYDFSVSDDYWVDKIWYGIGAPGVSPGGYTYYTEPFNLTIVDNGTFTFILYVYANDTSGNIGSASVTYILNNSQPYTPPVPPPIPVEEPQPVYKAKIEKIRLSNDGFLNPGEDLRTTISLSNIGDKDLENARIAVVVPELGIWKKIGPFDLDEGDKVTREVVLDIPDDIEPGEYVARIVVSNGKTRRVVHRHIIIE